jgi:hypothetical protein
MLDLIGSGPPGRSLFADAQVANRTYHPVR